MKNTEMILAAIRSKGGFKTSNPPVCPEGDLCFNLALSISRFGREPMLDAILGHVAGESKGKFGISAKNNVSVFLGIESLFRNLTEFRKARECNPSLKSE